MNSPYQIGSNSAVLSHFPGSLLLFQDEVSGGRDETEVAKLLIRARINSGDYFITLVTELEQVADSLTPEAPAAVELQRIIAELVYLHDNYSLTKK